MNNKFKIGDPVVIVKVISGTEGDKYRIIKVDRDNNTFDVKWMYLISDGRKYYLEDHLKFDIQTIRDEKLNYLLNKIW